MKRAVLLFVSILLACSSRPAAAQDWTPRDYVKAGVPDLGHAWTSAELTAAVAALTKLAAEHPEHLPRYAGAGKAVFAKLIARAPAEDRKIAVGPRFGAHVERYQALNAASKLYIKDVTAPVPREAIELWGALLVESVATTALVDPFLASIPKDDPSLANRRAGLAQFRDGIGEMFVGCVMIANDTRVPEDDRRAILHFVEVTAPTLFPTIPAARQTAVRDYLTKLVPAAKGKLHDAAAAAQRALPQ